MAHDAAYPYGSEENEQMAQILEAQEIRAMREHWAYQEEMERLEEERGEARHGGTSQDWAASGSAESGESPWH